MLMSKYVYRALMINMNNKSHKVKEFEAPEILGPIDLGIKLHMNVYESWKYDVFSDKNVVVIGKGPFTGGKLIGTHRLIIVFRSPLTKALHVSALGGAAYKFMGIGVDALVIEGKSGNPTIILVKGDENGNINVMFKELSIKELLNIYEGYRNKKGTYALTLYLLNEYWSFIKENNARALVVGPAALNTVFGAIFSIDFDINKKTLALGSEDSAARGGGGSVLFKAHNVVAVVAGGKFKPSKINPRINDLSLINEISKRVLGKSYVDAIVSATVKYRFDKKMGTGGTFGVNYPHYKDLVPVFGFNMIYLSKYMRMRIHDMIITHFWRPFNEEVFMKTKSWYTCGEPCVAACKKVWRGKKVDYEPFNGLGPMIGVFDLELVRELVDLVDELGLDAIETGHIVSWIFDAIERGLLKPEDVGLSSKPYFNPLEFRQHYSKHNATLAMDIIKGLVGKKSSVLRIIAEKGIRVAAKELDKMFSDRVRVRGVRFEDLVVYVPLGNEGYMTPNYYWTPGMIAPLFMLGRYWTNYTPTFMEPEDFAASSLLRAIKEYEIDNAGICRFHRRWAEKVLRSLYKELLGVDVDLDNHAKIYYKKIAEYAIKAKAVPEPWEGSKTMDLISSIASELSVKEWMERFSSEFSKSIAEWWRRFYMKICKELGIKCE